MSEAEDRETNEQLAARIQQAIRGVTERIQGYVQSVDRFSGEYDTEVENLRLLIEQLRRCLDRLRELANGLTTINQRILLLGTRIENLQRRVTAEVEAAGAGCRQALQDIEALLEPLNDLPGQFEIDIKTLRTQVTDLEGVIESLCGEAEDTISTMLTAKSAQINETLDRMEARDNGSGGDATDAETKSGSATTSATRLPTPEGQGRDLMGNTVGQGSQVAAMRARMEGDVGQLMSGTTRATSPAIEAARQEEARRLAARGLRRSREDRQRRQGNRGNPISSGPRSQRGRRSDVPSERLGFLSGTSTGRQIGGWQTPEKLESLSRTRPVRTLAVLKKKKKKKTKKKKHRKRNKKTRGRNRRKKRSRKR